MGPVAEKKWLLPGFIVLAVMCLFLITAKFGQQAQARVDLQAARETGIMVIPIQLERDLYGLAMIDTSTQNLWIYEINSRGPAYNRLKLSAARSWKYDKFLQQYNTAEPKPEQVRMILENLGQPLQDANAPKQIEPNVAAPTPQINDSNIVKIEPDKGDSNNIQEDNN